MAIKKAKANYHNGTGYDVFHYETQVKQVKVVDANGVVTGDLEIELANINDNIDTVDTRVDNANAEIDILQTDVGTVSTLTTTAKKVVPAINELKTKADANKTSIDDINVRLTSSESGLSAHDHDNLYLKLSGGSLTAKTSMANNQSYAGKNTSGADLNIGKVDVSNQVLLGDATAKAIIQASGGDVKVYNGTSSYKVYHAGNHGSGSGLDADKLDGVEGSKYARTDEKPIFSAGLEVGGGTDIILKANSGSADAGDLIFQKGDGTQVGKLVFDVNGNMQVHAGGINGLTVKSSGYSYSEYGMELNSKSRETQVVFKKDDADAGTGLYMNKERNEFGQYDWAHGRYVYKYDRADNNFQFGGSIGIQGHKISVQSSQPSSPNIGDIWFDI